MRAGIFQVFLIASLSSGAHAQSLTVAGGETIRANTKHDYAAVELNLPWRESIWASQGWQLDLNHAFSAAGFRDVNKVYLVSWAPNLILSPKSRGEVYPYFQIGFGVALMTDDYFESEDNDPRHTGTTDMGSHGQFVSSLTLGMNYHDMGFRVRVYHYSNAELAHPNDGIDVAEFGVSYRY
jgi:hypothetical protein